MENEGYEHDMKNNDMSQEQTVSNLSPKEIKNERRMIYKNVLLISFAFLLLFMAFESLSKLQSSINPVNNLGTWANAMIYGSLILSCCFLPSIIINKLKVKWALVTCVCCYSTYMAAQFYPRFYTFLPTAFILGLGAAPMWSAKCTYLTHVAHRLASFDGSAPEHVVVKFFGIFFFFFQCNSIFGNIISTSVLSTGKENHTSLTDEEMAECGSSYCPDQLGGEDNGNETDDGANDNFETDINLIYIISGIFLACSLSAALLITIFVDPLTRFGEDERREGKENLTGLQLLVATFNHMLKPNQIFVIPITFWSGIEQGFFGADFTAGFVTCAYGVHVVGQVLIAYGACNALTSLGSGFIIKKVGRLPIFILGACMNLTVIIVMLSWTATNSTKYVVFILAAMWGVGDAIWQTQINALYGVLFVNGEESAYSNYRLWESFGFLLAFITQAMGVCVFPKIIMTLVFLVLGMSGYLFLEYSERRKGGNKGH